jgi:hypothetical protein
MIALSKFDAAVVGGGIALTLPLLSALATRFAPELALVGVLMVSVLGVAHLILLLARFLTNWLKRRSTSLTEDLAPVQGATVRIKADLGAAMSHRRRRLGRPQSDFPN